MRLALLYRHDDGRIIEVSSDGSAAEAWLIYPERHLLQRFPSMDAAKSGLPEGFSLDEAVFAPPCPKCAHGGSPMNVVSGMYVCPKCGTEF